jgi:hypothetical protein
VIAAEIEKLLTDQRYIATMLANLDEIRAKLGGGGAAQNVASLALDLINNSASPSQKQLEAR